jgi:uncharacterized membrane protein
MQSIAVIALVVLLVMLFRWLGPPVRHLPHENETQNSSKTNPDEDVPPPMMMG